MSYSDMWVGLAAWSRPSESHQIDFGLKFLNSATNIWFVRSPHSRRVTVARPETIDTNILRDAVSKDIVRILPRMFRRGSQTVSYPRVTLFRTECFSWNR